MPVPSTGLPLWSSAEQIREPHEGAHYHSRNGGQWQADGSKLRCLDSPCCGNGLRVHKFLVFDCPVDIHPIGYSDTFAYEHRDGLPAADREAHGEGIAVTEAVPDLDG